MPITFHRRLNYEGTRHTFMHVINREVFCEAHRLEAPPIQSIPVVIQVADQGKQRQVRMIHSSKRFRRRFLRRHASEKNGGERRMGNTRRKGKRKDLNRQKMKTRESAIKAKSRGIETEKSLNYTMPFRAIYIQNSQITSSLNH